MGDQVLQNGENGEKFHPYVCLSVHLSVYTKGSEGQLAGFEGQPERSEGLSEGSEGLPEASESLL